MAWLRKVKAGLVKYPVDQFIGEEGTIFFNEETGELFHSDGVTQGGTSVLKSIVNKDSQNPSDCEKDAEDDPEIAELKRLANY